MIGVVFLGGCASDPKPQPAPSSAPAPLTIVGWWRAEDDTIFHFRADGTFIGKDYVGRPIWGNWVDLGHQKYGFQSQFHMKEYAPQYAVVTGADRMKYAGSAAVVFIYSHRISEAAGQPEVDDVMAAMPSTNQSSQP